MRCKILLISALATLFVLPAYAQNAPANTPTRLRGTIEKLDGRALLIKTREGAPVTVMLDENFGVVGVVKKTLADVKVGTYIASTSVKGQDGKLHALELHFLPETARSAEGQFPWDLAPDSLMTNANVTGMSVVGAGQSLKVNYKGTETEVLVAPDTPIVDYVPMDAAALKPGAAVVIFAQKKPDGTVVAPRVTVERDGVKPPM